MLLFNNTRDLEVFGKCQSCYAMHTRVLRLSFFKIVPFKIGILNFARFYWKEAQKFGSPQSPRKNT